jgi:uncharacterized RDD family membrane protein YckC
MWRRAIAFVIDLVPLALIAVVQNTPGVPDNGVVAGISLLILMAYFAGMNYWYGGTVGKRMMGLRVALPASPDVVVQLIARAIVKIICIFPPMQTIYALIAIWRRDGRSLADFATGSRVVDALTLSTPQPLSVGEKIVASVLLLALPIVLFVLAFFFLAVTVGEWQVQ